MEMEEERIGMVLVRASELRSKIANCIHHSTTEVTPNNGDSDPSSVDEDTEALLNICYAFDSLESQLASLQVIRHFLFLFLEKYLFFLWVLLGFLILLVSCFSFKKCYNLES